MISNQSSGTGLSNQHPAQGITWHNDTASARLVATYTDDGILPDEDLQVHLSIQEKQQAAALQDAVEHRHFIARRCFQRLFLSDILAFDQSPATIAILHKKDARPVCLDAPDLHLSFSSSGNTFIACANRQNPVGVDIERTRVIKNVAALAKRFFTFNEAAALAALPAEEQDLHFLYYWTAKEAALKAIGQGIVSGLNTFSVERIGNSPTYKIQHSAEHIASWDIQHLELVPQHLVAVVEKNALIKINKY
jgi:4'-phosphopantetheinyl transferase